MKNTYIVLAILALGGILGAVLLIPKSNPGSMMCTKEAKICPDGSSVGRTGPTCDFAACPFITSTTTPPSTSLPTAPVTTMTTKLHQKISIEGIIVTPLEVIEDSRCPPGAQCIQAGTVKVSVMLESGDSQEKVILTLHDNVQFMNKNVELVGVSPAVASTLQGMYSFTFGINKNIVTNKGTLRGMVTISPVCPVERVDTPCLPSPEMYAARKVFVYSSDKRTLVTTLTPDAQGKFTTILPVGSYSVDMTHERVGSISGVPKVVTIEKENFTDITISIDTGIR